MHDPHAAEGCVAAQGVSIPRARDVSAEVRATVIEGLGDWICADPVEYLTDTYLRYIGWALSDRVRARMPG